ncbi:MAG: glycosyltransferase family 1 protein, partial [Acidobacteriota bacterium]
MRLTRPFTGVGRYIECLLNEWAAWDVPFQEIVLYAHSALRQDLAVFPLQRYKLRLVGRKLPDPLWEWTALKRAHREVDLLFCPSYTVPLGYPGRCAVSYLGPAQHPARSLHALRGRLYDRLQRYSARRADHVFTCSRIVKERVVDVYGVAPERVSITYLAASQLFRPIDDQQELRRVRQHFLGSQDPFILFVGKLSGRHSIPELLEAFAQVQRRGNLPHRLLLAGPDTLGLNVPARARSAGLAGQVIHIPFVPHAELPALYSAAEIFIFPASQAEGFGIPVLEAMACGTPVISTNQGSIPEFASQSALLVERSSPEEMSQAILRMATDQSLRD